MTSVENVQPEVTQAGGVVIGRLVALDDAGRPLVDYPGLSGNEPVPALCTHELRREHLGREVALMFESAHGRPVVLGPVVDRVQDREGPAPVEAERDGERLLLTAEREIVLRCGKASITLTRAGKVILRGKYLLSRSSGVNRIKGGSVQIN